MLGYLGPLGLGAVVVVEGLTKKATALIFIVTPSSVRDPTSTTVSKVKHSSHFCSSQSRIARTKCCNPQQPGSINPQADTLSSYYQTLNLKALHPSTLKQQAKPLHACSQITATFHPAPPACHKPHHLLPGVSPGKGGGVLAQLTLPADPRRIYYVTP